MQRWFFDFETYWSADYTLRKLTAPEYITDPRFEALGCAIINDHAEVWVDGPDLPKIFNQLPWGDMFATSHNSLFDMLILALRYGKVPAFYGDTLSMARNWVSHATGRSDLATVANYFGFAPKGTTVNSFKGMDFATIQSLPALHREMKEYALHDARLCKNSFEKMIRDGFPVRELEVIDMVVRMATQPVFAIDQAVLSEHLAMIQAKKAALLADAFLNADNVSSIMSDQQLAAKLLFLGVDPIPTKVSKTTGKETFAFAKTDQEFTDLLDHDEPMVQALVAARLGHKSTIEETRTKRMIDVSLCMSSMPVPLKYSGAHTHRFSGDWKLNLQNLPNGSDLRRALKAPKGKVVVSVDASQIEARINAELSGQQDLVDAFRTGVDVYSLFAEDLYGYPVGKNTPKERFVGKTSILSLGYQSSWPVLQNMLRNKGDVRVTDSEALTIVQHYRNKYGRIVDNWRFAQDTILPSIAMGHIIQWGPVRTERYAIVLPNGNKLRYPNLRHGYSEQYGKTCWTFTRGSATKLTYGAKIVENVVQALAFVFIMEVALTVKHATDGEFLPAHQVHDELIYVVDEKYGRMIRDLVIHFMSTPPEWMPGLPVAAEGHIGDNYGELKG